jgi:tetratricopeptide (TPR) repeat protein
VKKLLLACAIAVAFPVHASVLPNEAALPLVKEGNVASSKGQYQLALEKYSEAMKADPEASIPLSSIARVLTLAADQSTGEQAERLRRQAEGAARQALRLASNDPLAQEVLRTLEDTQEPPLHKPSAEVWKQMQEAEILFQSGQYDDARARYEGAAQLDPQYSPAWVYAADCFYLQKNWPEAEVRFRKATEIEPLNAQAWRYLADTLAWEGKTSASEDALLKGIAAQPSQLPTWNKLGSLRNKAGAPLTQLKLEPRAYSVYDAQSSKYTVHVNGPEGAEKKDADLAVWMMLAIGDAQYRSDKQQSKTTLSPFAADLAAWSNAMKVADEVAANGLQLKEPGLQAMQTLYKADQLEPALLLLRYKESYRPELEAWKKEHPHGVRTFIATYGLAP